MSADGERSTLGAYRRLVKFARPYAGRLMIGVIAGMFCGGADFGLLTAIPQVIKPIESRPAAVSEDPAPPPPPAAIAKPGVVDRLIEKAGKWGIRVQDESGRVTRQALIVIFLVAPPLILLRCLAMYLNRYCVRWVAARVIRDIRDQLFNRLQSQSLKFFGKSDVGQMISNCTNDAALVEHSMSLTVADLARAPFEIAAAVGFVLIFTIRNDMLGLLALSLVAVPLCVVPIAILGRRLKQYSHTALSRVSDLVSRMHENFTGIRVVKAYHMEQKEFERFQAMDAKYFRAVVRALRAELLMSPAMEAVASLLGLAFVLVC